MALYKYKSKIKLRWYDRKTGGGVSRLLLLVGWRLGRNALGFDRDHSKGPYPAINPSKNPQNIDLSQ